MGQRDQLRSMWEENNQIFGELEPLFIERRDTYGDPMWMCQCDCGNQKVIRARNMLSGQVVSCGCRKMRNLLAQLGRGEFLTPEVRSMRDLFRQYRKNAKKRRIHWDLTAEEAVDLFQGDCYICGASPSRQFQNDATRPIAIVNGIDRINNDLGYVPGNVASCCASCNIAKRQMSLDEFLGWVHRIALRQEWA